MTVIATALAHKVTTTAHVEAVKALTEAATHHIATVIARMEAAMHHITKVTSHM